MMRRGTWVLKATRVAPANNHQVVVDSQVSRAANMLVDSTVVSRVAKKEHKIWTTTMSSILADPADRIAAVRTGN